MLYRWTRDLHLYAGLFISPFLLVFAASVFFLNHAKVRSDAGTGVQTVQNVTIQNAIERLQGKDAVAAARDIAHQLGVDGEIGFTRFVRQTSHFVFPLSRPGREVSVDVDVKAATATIASRETGFWESIAYLHKMPGPHNVEIRGNWPPTVMWGRVADLTIYLTLFITISGVYLWWALRAERRMGLALLGAGIATVVGLIHALLH